MVGRLTVNFVYVCCLVLKRTCTTDTVALIILLELDGATVQWLSRERLRADDQALHQCVANGN